MLLAEYVTKKIDVAGVVNKTSKVAISVVVHHFVSPLPLFSNWSAKLRFV